MLTAEEPWMILVQPVYVTHLQDNKENVYSEVPEIELPLQSPPPSSAVQQLDSLMTHLFNIQSKFPVSKDPPQESPTLHFAHSNNLNNMLGDLEQEMKNLGAAATSKGVCASCGKAIAGKMITVLGKTWHVEHFTCTHCGEEIGTQQFFERNGLAYCKRDYQDLFSPPCAYCAAPVLDKVLTAMDKTWHPEHFFCAHCGEVFGEEGFHERNGKPFCRKDFLNIFSPRCSRCNQPVLDNYFSALNAAWHPECFVCGDCSCTFSQGSFFELNGHPYCELDYHRRQGSICHTCQKPIIGRCVSAMGSRFHPEHFVCAFCLKQLNQGIFQEQNDKPYCNACYGRLFV
ncbi:leupaxin isoform X2 [Microcaecilia unicolor]|uniref:Leupaxin isoform X2 n=1 Tax=Microcaecilia unicolor TaxID=1415580 RepID=A0A6P7ZQC4_9AMPH|nr:leupaxin isoform X2 [Microcaecilia unicolor]